MAASDQNFVHLHVHSDYSLLDGASQLPAMVKRGEELGMPALALTDHGVMYGAIELLKLAKMKKDLRGMEKALERITKAYNLDKEDLDLPDPARFQPPVQLLTINYNFINFPSFSMIDAKAQEKLLELGYQE